MNDRLGELKFFDYSLLDTICCLELANRGSRNGYARCLGSLAEHLGGLVSTNTSTPNTALFFILVGANKKALAK